MILLTQMLTTTADGHGCAWNRSLSLCPASRQDLRLWTPLDMPDLATDQKVGGSSPSERATSSQAKAHFYGVRSRIG